MPPVIDRLQNDPVCVDMHFPVIALPADRHEFGGSITVAYFTLQFLLNPESHRCAQRFASGPDLLGIKMKRPTAGLIGQQRSHRGIGCNHGRRKRIEFVHQSAGGLHDRKTTHTACHDRVNLAQPLHDHNAGEVTADGANKRNALR